MNKKLDFYNGKGTSQTVDYTPETDRRVGNRKLGLIIALSLALVMDIIVTTLLGIVTKGVKYFIAPALLALVDALFLADVFFINLKQKYTIGHRVLYVVLSIVLTFITAMIPAAAMRMIPVRRVQGSMISRTGAVTTSFMPLESVE